MSLAVQIQSPKDKELVDCMGYEIDSVTNDLKVATGDNVILYAAQRRILTERGSWLYDINYGSTLRKLLRLGRKFTSQECEVIVKQALEPMVQDGRIKEIVSVKLLHQNYDYTTLFFEVILKVGSQQYTQSYTLNFL